MKPKTAKSKYQVQINFCTNKDISGLVNKFDSIVINKMAKCNNNIVMLGKTNDIEIDDVVDLEVICKLLTQLAKEQPPIVKELTKQISHLEKQIVKLQTDIKVAKTKHKATVKVKAIPKIIAKAKTPVESNCKAIQGSDLFSNDVAIKKSRKKVTQPK